MTDKTKFGAILTEILNLKSKLTEPERVNLLVEILTSEEWMILHGWHSHICDTMQDDFEEDELEFIEKLGLNV